jgi:uncharacterized protein YkwD
MTGLSLKVEDDIYIDEPVSLISKSFAKSNEAKGLRGHSDSNYHDHHMKDYVADKKMINYDKVSSEEERELQDSISEDMHAMLALVNQARSDAGVDPLCFNAKLNEAALAHSQDMADNSFFTHEGTAVGGSNVATTVGSRVSAVGYGWSNVAENIASGSGYTTSHDMLMDSSGHRTNILNSAYTQIGIGFATYPSTFHFGNEVITQVFGRPLSSDEGCMDTNGNTNDNTNDNTNGNTNGNTNTEGRGCSDVPDWYDSDGEIYNCQWYSYNNHCRYYGNGYKNFGFTANQACCVCGGGESN